jgi:hypothetical protein
MDNRLRIGRSRFEACRAKEGKRTDAGAQRPTDREEDDMAPMTDEAPIPPAVLLSNDSPFRRLRRRSIGGSSSPSTRSACLST